MSIQQTIKDIPRYYNYESLILSHVQETLEQQIKIIDSALLKIIGHKNPVSEDVLIKKYGFPEPLSNNGLLTGKKSLEEILAAL